MAIKISIKENNKIAYLILANCHYIKGSFSIDNPTFSVSQYFNEISLENMYRIIDENNNFELISGGIALAQGMESEFGENFENFLKK
ncbi:hypothetical protein [Chryseobacterium luteum]|uniref:Uncharacterized protein n=1 Tax=Chryseobacterium luteum TaxID=421531 RepID=A0A085ZU50_9FLAO|nr:hypothetical protein [Chryseobacterium luteum]KFF07964.1 hypothetical protein IX38_07305 [Chryseobacterium luteum]